jgi:phage tail-like protein
MARVDPYMNFRFLVEIDGIVQAGFSECTGLGSSVEVVEYREGGDMSSVRKLPGKSSYSDITLKWGVTDSRELYDWHLKALTGQLERKNGAIILLDVHRQEEKARWTFYGAWPSKWEGPKLDAKANEVAVDTLVVACERVEKT